MILREGDKVKKRENGIVYAVEKIRGEGFVILRSEDGSSTALMSMAHLDLHFALVSSSPTEG